MRCPECDYPLWNLKARDCPECGRAFRPSEFEFVSNSVRFCCPQCDQAYYGTDDKGHLVPPSFDCVQCGRHLQLDEMVLRPAEGVAEDQTRVDHVPWLQRSTKGFLKSWVLTIGRSFVAPHRLARGLPEQPRAGHAWWFLLFSWMVFAAGGMALPLLGIALVAALSGDKDAIGVTLFAVGIIVGVGMAVSVYVALWALVTQGLLRLTGGANAPIERTIEALCYSSGAAAIIVIPCLGPYCGSMIGGIWWLISAIMILTLAQQAHGGRVSLAVLAFPGLLAALGLAGYMSFVLYLLPNMTTAAMQSARATSMQIETQLVTDAVVEYALDHEGLGPDHATMLLLDTDLAAGDLLLGSSPTNMDDVTLPGNQTLLDVDTLLRRPREEAIRAIGESMPPDVIAHRTGDFVFTYHGIDFAEPDPKLWIVIASVDPDGGSVDAAEPIGVGLADGSVLAVAAEEFDAARQRQNERRDAAGLSPIPDPSSVTNQRPATVSDQPANG